MGADRAAARFGATTQHHVPETPDDPEQQSALIEQALSQRPDAVVLVPAHPTRVNQAIRAINDSGVPLIALVNRFTEGRYVSFVGSDDYQPAGRVARYVYDRLAGTGNVVLVEGPPDSVTNGLRVSAFRDAAADYPGVTIVGSCQGAFLREPARAATTGLLAQLPRVDAILAANDSMALGALDALDAAGRSCLVAGINAVPEAIEAIKSGRMAATADFSAMNMAYVATECAVRHLRGESVPDEIMLPVQVIDRQNCSL